MWYQWTFLTMLSAVLFCLACHGLLFEIFVCGNLIRFYVCRYHFSISILYHLNVSWFQWKISHPPWLGNFIFLKTGTPTSGVLPIWFFLPIVLKIFLKYINYLLLYENYIQGILFFIAFILRDFFDWLLAYCSWDYYFFYFFFLLLIPFITN